MSEHDTPEAGSSVPEPEPNAAPGAVPMPDSITVGAPGTPPSPVMGPPVEPPADRHGLSNRWKTLIAIVILAALTAIGVGWWLYYETMQAQGAAVERLNEASELVESADEVVLEVDAVVRAEIDAEVGGQAEALVDRLEPARDDLTSAIRLIGQARVDLPDGEIAYAEALEESALARLEMLGQADTILEYNIKAAAALDPALAAWDLVVEAGNLSIRAVEEYNKLTRGDVTRSAELTAEATKKVGEAQALFSEAATGFPEVEFTPYLEYCTQKLAALEISKQANVAYLADKPAEANVLSQRYNEAETALVETANALPASPAELIAGGYERYAVEATEDYFEARARATEADGRLREAAGEESDPVEDAGDADDEEPAED